jgi:hypothetical protein
MKCQRLKTVEEKQMKAINNRLEGGDEESEI